MDFKEWSLEFTFLMRGLIWVLTPVAIKRVVLWTFLWLCLAFSRGILQLDRFSWVRCSSPNMFYTVGSPVEKTHPVSFEDGQ